MKHQEIKFKNKFNSYSIFIGERSINLLPNKIKQLFPKTKKVALIVDKKVPVKLKKDLKAKIKKYEITFINFEANERNKSIKISE